MQAASDVVTAFSEAPLCFLATCFKGVPNVVPVGFKWVIGGRLFMADLFFRKTRENLASNFHAAVSVAFVNPKRGFQAKGLAKVHVEGPEYSEVEKLLRGQGVSAKLNAVIELPLTEVYGLDPGASAGQRIV